MRFSTIIAFLACMVIAVIASPVESVQSAGRNPSGTCLSPAEAQQIVIRYIAILSHGTSDLGDANATAQALLDDKYTEISESVLSLKGLPLGAVTFPNKEAYIEGVLNGPAATGLETIHVFVAGCTRVLWYWNFHGVGNKAYEVKGFNLFDITPEMKILTTNLEFNSVAWGLDTGFTITRPGA